MIIGRGYIANLFKESQEDKNTLIFASGVSDSNCVDSKEYERELELLEKAMDQYPEAKIVYFSTVSVLDPSLQEKKYIQHKKFIEKLIPTKKTNYLIFRLPNLISEGLHPHLLIPFFWRKMVKGEAFEVHAHAYRYFIDVTDAFSIMRTILHTHSSGIYNIVNSTCPLAIMQLVDIFQKILGLEHINAKIIEKGCYYEADIKNTLPFIRMSNVSFFEKDDHISYIDYIKKSIEKYIPLFKL